VPNLTGPPPGRERPGAAAAAVGCVALAGGGGAGCGAVAAAAAARTSGGGGASEVGQPRACAMALLTALLESSLANCGFGLLTDTGGGACTGGRSERGGIM